MPHFIETRVLMDAALSTPGMSHPMQELAMTVPAARKAQPIPGPTTGTQSQRPVDEDRFF
jgi:hypothetical protein